MRSIPLIASAVVMTLSGSPNGVWAEQDSRSPARIGVSFPKTLCAEALDGRMLLMLSKDHAKEPRLQISNSMQTQQIFGIDVDGLKPGQDAFFEASVLGYPLASLQDVPPGQY